MLTLIKKLPVPALAHYLGGTENLALSQRGVELKLWIIGLAIQLKVEKHRLKPSELLKKRGRNNE
ncbi:MAG: hypothetical protein EAZ79_20395 [Oscillatoriales cyanobacterium]|nr:MAG: hypothetical protein EAZ79_20395 [Oscillatoriales cyanobacterium]TAF37466.1 MAG: hypothetical protein EAZ69_07325 [Oscillatoriales cyanobacterium]